MFVTVAKNNKTISGPLKSLKANVCEMYGGLDDENKLQQRIISSYNVELFDGTSGTITITDVHENEISFSCTESEV